MRLASHAAVDHGPRRDRAGFESGVLDDVLGRGGERGAEDGGDERGRRSAEVFMEVPAVLPRYHCTLAAMGGQPFFAGGRVTGIDPSSCDGLEGARDKSGLPKSWGWREPLSREATGDQDRLGESGKRLGRRKRTDLHGPDGATFEGEEMAHALIGQNGSRQVAHDLMHLDQDPSRLPPRKATGSTCGSISRHCSVQ